MSGLNPVDVVEEDAADLLFPKGLYLVLGTSNYFPKKCKENLPRAKIN
jgi:hypothetical protein